MPVEITMPQLSDTMHEGTILSWLKKEGDTVSRGDTLAEVATDKADLEIESFHEGTLLKIFAEKGTTVRVGSIIAVIGEKGESVSAGAVSSKAVSSNAVPSGNVPTVQAQHVIVGAAPEVNRASTATIPPAASPANNGFASTHIGEDEDRVKISPLAKNYAKTQGVDYSKISGSGEGGRIVKSDVEKVISQTAPNTLQAATLQAVGRVENVKQVSTPVTEQVPASSPQVSSAAYAAGKSTEPLSRMRQTIAQRMVESTTSIPHFYVTAKVRVDQLTKLKNSLKPLPQYEGLTYNHLIIRAVATVLRSVPRVNASYNQGNLLQPQAINIGIVTAVQDGLLIPVLKNADQLPLADIVAEGRAVVQRARSGRPKPDDLVGGTFSISNMGLFDVESFTAIISPGQGAILAVSPIQEEPVIENSAIVVGSVMRLTLSVDHRIIDGVVAGEFVTELKRLLEDPVLLLA